MNTFLYDRLLGLASEGGLTTYGDEANLLELDLEDEQERNRMTEFLLEIAEHEQNAGRPMLTALVVHAGGDNTPGEGFFSLANDYGRFDGTRIGIRRLRCWVDEVKKVHSHWSSNRVDRPGKGNLT